MERKLEIATRVLCLRGVLTYSRECEGTLGGGPLERNVCYLYTHYWESSKILEGDYVMDRVPRCRPLNFKNVHTICC